MSNLGLMAKQQQLLAAQSADLPGGANAMSRLAPPPPAQFSMGTPADQVRGMSSDAIAAIQSPNARQDAPGAAMPMAAYMARNVPQLSPSAPIPSAASPTPITAPSPAPGAAGPSTGPAMSGAMPQQPQLSPEIQAQREALAQIMAQQEGSPR